jgi:hypothetical protein
MKSGMIAGRRPWTRPESRQGFRSVVNLDEERDEKKKLKEALALNHSLAVAYYLKEDRPGSVVELEPTLLADQKRHRQFNKRGVTRLRWGGDCPGSPLQAVIVEAKCCGGTADPVHLCEPNGQIPKRSRDPLTQLPLSPPRLEPGSPQRQVRR